MLAQNGKAEYRILTSAKPSAQEEKAAEELKLYLKKICGADFDMVKEPCDLSGRYISIGKTSLAETQKPHGWGADLGREGCGIAVKDKNIYLFGGTARGPLYSVYMFLEEDLGCRWYTSDAEYVPEKSTLELNIKSRISKPAFPFIRDAHTFYTLSKDFTLRNRGNGFYCGIPKELGGHIRFAKHNGKWWFAHTYENILPSTEENLKKYPECFMMDQNGKRVVDQLCPMNDMVRKLAEEKIIDAMKHDSGEINLSQNDCTARCHCPLCEAVIAREETTAAPHLLLVNHVAEEAAKAGFAKRKIIFLGYQQTRKPPRHLIMADNTALWLCTDIQSHAKFIPVSKNREFVENLRQWKNTVSTIYIWDYYVNFNKYLAYEPSLYAMAENLKFYAANGISGVMTQGALQSPGAAMQGAYSWILEHLLWNPDQDVEKLLQDYVRGYFGPAATPMEKLYFEVYNMGRNGQGGPKDVKAFTKFENACLEEARKLIAENGRPDLSRRVELASIPARVREINTGTIDFAKEGKPFSENFNNRINEFEKLAGELKITHYGEGTKFADWLQKIRKRNGLQLGAVTKNVIRQNQPVTIHKLSSLWKFKGFTLLSTDEEIRRETEKSIADELDADLWDDYIDNLGVGWEAQGYPGFLGTGIFRNQFRFDSVAQYKYCYLFFGSVDCEATVYINGKKAIEHTLASTGKTIYNLWNHPFAKEVKSFIRPGKNNVAVVCTNHGPAGGIYMPVFLVGSNYELDRKIIYELTDSRHPYGLDGNDEIKETN